MIFRSSNLMFVLLLCAATGCGASPESAAGLDPASGPPADGQQISYEPFARLLLDHVDQAGMVDYGALKASRADLDLFVSSLGSLSPAVYESWDTDAKIAFWINAYNALTLKAIVDHYPIRSSMLRSVVFPKNSIRQIPGVWDNLSFRVLGRAMTLDQIEHETLRTRFDEPRIHMALVCAAKSCPPLRWEPYDGERLDAQLEDQTVRFLGHSEKFRVDRGEGRLYLSSIFKWFGEDFINIYGTRDLLTDHKPATRAVLRFIADHLEGKEREFLLGGDYVIKYLDYDWSLNEP